MFKLVYRAGQGADTKSFNPSVGILGVQAGPDPPTQPDAKRFQSLGRDSGCSSWMACMRIISFLRVSIPRSGFWVFKQLSAQSWIVNGVEFQSLGRDSGCSSQAGLDATRDHVPGFNPSVGILGVQAEGDYESETEYHEFQSLGRDSGCSSLMGAGPSAGGIAVSIPRSGFWVFKLSSGNWLSTQTRVSIPRSGFWVFKPG